MTQILKSGSYDFKKKKKILSQIEEAQERGGYNHPVLVMAVTKTHPFSSIEECFKNGIMSIGENTIQEAEQKFKELKPMPGLEKRFIGKLQSNKVNKCLALFDRIDSVDSVKLANRINNRAIMLEKTIPVLLEVNTSGENQKNGFQPRQVEEMFSCIERSNLTVTGLMTIGPRTKDREKSRAAFIRLREVREELKQKNVKDLSMGMSGDFELAVEEGSTVVRIGTALFGTRNT